MLLAGLILAVVLAWTLLSFGLSLPFLLGLFFFMLFGLIIGAAMFRFGVRSRPLPKAQVVGATVLVALTCWLVSLTKECLDFPDDFVKRAMPPKGVYIPPEPGSYERVRSQLREYIVSYLQREYPPGGALGYLQMAAAGEPVIVDMPGQPKKVRIPPPAKAGVWWTRVILALVLGFVAIYSQTAALARAREEAESESAG